MLRVSVVRPPFIFNIRRIGLIPAFLLVNYYTLTLIKIKIKMQVRLNGGLGQGEGGAGFGFLG